MHCPYCFNEVDINQKICPFCNSKMTGAFDTTVSSGVNNTNKGYKYDGGTVNSSFKNESSLDRGTKSAYNSTQNHSNYNNTKSGNSTNKYVSSNGNSNTYNDLSNSNSNNIFQSTTTVQKPNPYKPRQYTPASGSSISSSSSGSFGVIGIVIVVIVLMVIVGSILKNVSVNESNSSSERRTSETYTASNDSMESVSETDYPSDESYVDDTSDGEGGETAEELTEEMTETFNDGQIFPNSSNEYLTAGDVENLSSDQIQEAINEIYARNGYTFRDENIRNYFMGYDWYNPTIPADEFDSNSFSEVEKANVKLLSSYRD